MQEQIKILTSEVTKLKHRDSNKEQQSVSKNYQQTETEFHHYHLHLHQESTAYCQETALFFVHKIQKTCRTPL